MASDLGVSVLIVTYNRAESVRQSLEDLTAISREGLAVEYVIIDQNSDVSTREAVRTFAGRLPVRYLFEGRQGKNSALNKALNECRLGEIVLFIDGDVVPHEDWLQSVVSACDRWPEFSVFGGRQLAEFPMGAVPD